MMNFWDKFIPERSFVTHEMTQCEKIITVGMWEGQRLAFKRGTELEDEIKIMQKIGYHPNIIKLISEIEGNILMEGIKNGLTLSEYCGWDQTSLPIKTCISLIRQLASALNYLHKQGIIHHDVNDKNVLVDITGEEPVLKLCDFGLSEITDENGHGKAENRELGTNTSMAPEQLLDNDDVFKEPITCKIDVYSFGGICNGILLKGRTMDQAIYFTPIKLIKIIEKCREKYPKNRPDMSKILELLEDTHLLEETHYSKIIELYQQFQKKGTISPELELIYQEILPFL
jgi:serine/threonine protein kinase